MSKPSFIISFDCEGKWGLADHLTDEHQALLTRENLSGVYSRLNTLLEKWEIRATFAFVGALMLSSDQFHAHPEWFHDVTVDGSNWLDSFRAEAGEKQYDGWFHPEIADVIADSPLWHELAAHGFSHLPLSEKLISKQCFDREMHSFSQAAALLGRVFRTLVYPRNAIGFQDELKNHGFIGYRKALYQRPSRLKNILREFHVLDRAQADGVFDRGIVAVPSGHFLNWRRNARKKVPVAVTLRRWRHMLDNAVRNNGVVHLWSHPHNFITCPSQFKVFEEILKHAAKHVKNGAMLNKTMEQYCDDIVATARGLG